MENQFVTLENREKLTITQVKDVDAFDENTLWANLDEGSIQVDGENLNIEKLSLDEGLLVVKGRITAFTYFDKKHKEKKSLKRLFGRGQR